MKSRLLHLVLAGQNPAFGDGASRRAFGQILAPAFAQHLGDPQAYLVDVITRTVAGHPQSQIDDLLPWAYASKPLKAVA